jgi:ribonuclease HI
LPFFKVLKSVEVFQ